MNLINEVRRRSRQVSMPVLGACVLLYFAYHTVQGDRGLLAYFRLGNEVDRAEVTLARVAAKREELERRVNRLKSDGMDLDLLEERARLILNRVRDDEIVLFLSPKG